MFSRLFGVGKSLSEGTTKVVGSDLMSEVGGNKKNESVFELSKSLPFLADIDNQLPDNLDPKIRDAVRVMKIHGFKTFESCQGGEGHCFFEPTIRFEGTEFDLLRAFEICELYGLKVMQVQRVFRKVPICVNGGILPPFDVVGEAWDKPFNEIIFAPFL